MKYIYWGKKCWKNKYVQLQVNCFLKKSPNTFKNLHAQLHCVHYDYAMFEESQPKAVRQSMLERLLGLITRKFFDNCLNTFKQSHAHLKYVHKNCEMFEECQPKGVRGVDYSK
jgi:hypothetical protein